MDLRRGPSRSGGPDPGDTIHCDFVDRAFDGESPKFACVLPDGEEVKVKFGETNAEVPGEVAATRLLWALGFGADTMFPVRVVCRGCPEFVSGRMVGARDRLSIRRCAHRSSRRPESLAVFLQHTDSKPEQQRLVCLDEEADASARCERPFMIMNDVGLTFGRANLANINAVGSVNLGEWAQTPVWKKDAACVGNLPRSLTVVSVVTAAIVFGMSWWGARAMLASAGMAQTPLGMLLAGGLPVLFVLPLPLYLTDRFVIRTGQKMPTA